MPFLVTTACFNAPGWRYTYPWLCLNPCFPSSQAIGASVQFAVQYIAVQSMSRNHMRRSWIFLFLMSLLVNAARADHIPNLEITPGAVHAGLTKEKICGIKWGRDE